MTLRRKLLVAFGGLAVLTLLAAAVTVYLTARWQGATEEQRAHYTRSLLLQAVRAETFQALAEVNDALAGAPDDYADARGDFERAIAGTEANFVQWRSLAGDRIESAEVQGVRTTYERLIANARQVFDLLEAGQREEAVRLVDDELDTGDYAQFQEVTELAAAADAQAREAVTAVSEDLRITALIMSAVIVIAALSLTLLIAAYLAQDLFRPLSQLRRSLDRLAGGETSERLPVDRADEFGKVALAFNGAAEAFERRVESKDAGPGPSRGGSEDGSAHAMLRGAAGGLRAAIADIRASASADQAESLARLESEATALEHALLTAMPSRLQLAALDPRHVAQDALTAIAPVLADRGVSCECEFEPQLHEILADRLQLRQIILALLQAALSVLPDEGGRIGIRVRGEEKARRLHIDVASSGGGQPGAPQNEDRRPPHARRPGEAHLEMIRRLVRDHGGSFERVEKPGGAAVAHLSFPLASPAGDH